MYIATRELRKRLCMGDFPNQIARWFKVRSGQSAIAYFTGFKWMFLPYLCFPVVGIMHWGKESVITSIAMILAMPLLLLLHLFVPLGASAKKFRWFEEHLPELSKAMESFDPGDRPLSLMDWHEIKERARQKLIEWAILILEEERARPSQVEDIRIAFRELFDLFKGYQLLDGKEEKGYDTFFARAQVELDKAKS